MVLYLDPTFISFNHSRSPWLVGWTRSTLMSECPGWVQHNHHFTILAIPLPYPLSSNWSGHWLRRANINWLGHSVSTVFESFFCRTGSFIQASDQLANPFFITYTWIHIYVYLDHLSFYIICVIRYTNQISAQCEDFYPLLSFKLPLRNSAFSAGTVHAKMIYC